MILIVSIHLSIYVYVPVKNQVTTTHEKYQQSESHLQSDIKQTQERKNKFKQFADSMKSEKQQLEFQLTSKEQILNELTKQNNILDESVRTLQTKVCYM